MAAVDPLAGAERMQWTASGEERFDDDPRRHWHVGGCQSLVSPAVIKYAENIFSAIDKSVLVDLFSFFTRYARNLHRERGLVVCREGMAPNAWPVVHAGGDFPAGWDHGRGRAN